MSGSGRAICGGPPRCPLAAVFTSVALASAALLCSCFASGAASAAVATTSGPSAGPSVGATGSPSVGAAPGAAAPNAARPVVSSVPSAARPAVTSATPPPATVYTGPVRPSQLGNGTLGRTTGAAKRPSAKGGGTSIAAIVVAALGALLVLACAAWALARRRAYEPRWWLSLQHSLGEAGYRTSSTWAEFSDWARRGG